MLAGVAVLAVFAAGCGGGDEESLTKAEYVKQGNAICEESVKELGEEVKVYAKEHESDSRPDKAATVAFMNETVFPAFESQVEELRELPAPEGDEEKLESTLDKLEGGIEEGKKDPENFFLETDNQMAEGKKAAEAYGVKRCMELF